MGLLQTSVLEWVAMPSPGGSSQPRDQTQVSCIGFPCGSAGKESACSAGDLGLVPGLGRSPGEGKGYPLQYSGLENSMDCTVYEVAKSRTWLSDFHFSLSLPHCRWILYSLSHQGNPTNSLAHGTEMITVRLFGRLCCCQVYCIFHFRNSNNY